MEKTKNERHADHLDEDFEVIELGSVSEETEGGFMEGTELAFGPNSRLQD